MRAKQVPVTSSPQSSPLLFKGMNRNEFIEDSEIKAGTNLSSEFLPALSPRFPREEKYPLARLSEPTYLFSAGGKLAWVDGLDFYYDGVKKGTIDGNFVDSMTDFNGFIVIFPSKNYYCYDADNDESGVFGRFGIGDCEDYRDFTGINAEVSNNMNLEKYGDRCLLVTSSASGTYGFVTTDYAFRVDATQYYMVTLWLHDSGTYTIAILDDDDNEIKTTTFEGSASWKRAAIGLAPKHLNETVFIKVKVTTTATAGGDDFYVDGIMPVSITDSEYDSNKWEDEDFLASYPFQPTIRADWCATHFNRVFAGYKSSVYASAWGDFKTWSKFEGTDQDSYATDVASEGDFTGMFVFDNHVTFFKDDSLEELYGTLPRNFQLIGTSGYGAISNDAIASGGGYMMFADSRNIYLYTGGRPQAVGTPLNEKGYEDIKLASDGNRFYALVIRSSTDRKLYCYDIRNACWMPEDDLDVVSFTEMNGSVYALDTDGKIWEFNSGTETITWSAETKVFDNSLFEKKKVKNIKLRLKMANGSSITIYSKKNDGQWVQEHSITNDSGAEEYSFVRKVVSVNRCNRYQLKFTGTGTVLVYGDREFDIGSQF